MTDAGFSRRRFLEAAAGLGAATPLSACISVGESEYCSYDIQEMQINSGPRYQIIDLQEGGLQFEVRTEGSWLFGEEKHYLAVYYIQEKEETNQIFGVEREIEEGESFNITEYIEEMTVADVKESVNVTVDDIEYQERLIGSETTVEISFDEVQQELAPC